MLVQDRRGHWERGLLCQSLGDGVQAEGPAGGSPRGGKACAIRGTAGWGGGRRWKRLAISPLGCVLRARQQRCRAAARQAGARSESHPQCPWDAAQRQGLRTLKGMFSRGPWAVTLEKPESWGETSSRLLFGGCGAGRGPCGLYPVLPSFRSPAFSLAAHQDTPQRPSLWMPKGRSEEAMEVAPSIVAQAAAALGIIYTLSTMASNTWHLPTSSRPSSPAAPPFPLSSSHAGLPLRT